MARTIITIRPNGSIQQVREGVQLDMGSRATCRVSHIEPVNVFLRFWFHSIRSHVKDDSALAGWTRRWRCDWRVNMAPIGGPILTETHSDRSDALRAEREWLLQEKGV